jgi:prepilin-type N-terminal cleavage/methylation domain-containing protein
MRKEISAGAVVFFQKGKKREYLLLNYIGGHWDFPKGHIEFNEKPEETVIREIKEETGLEVKLLKGFQEKITYTFKHKKEFVIKEVIFFIAAAKDQKVVLSEEHKGYVWLPFPKALELVTFNKDLLKKAENFLNRKNKRGFTIIETLLVIAFISILSTILVQILKPQSYFQRTRDIQRIADLRSLNIALKTYLSSSYSPNLGPTNSGVDETSPKIFISVPFDKEDVRSQSIIWGGKTYYLNQTSSTQVFKNNGSGWLPVDISSLPYPPLFSFPVDPLNSYYRKYFYSYVFKRSSSTFEINANLEFSGYKLNGSNDQVSTDGGDNNNIYEIGNDLTLMPNNLF